jgi:hypothetical protein
MTTKKVLFFSFFFFFSFSTFFTKGKKGKEKRSHRAHVDAAAAGPRRSLGRQSRCPMLPPRRE